MSIQTQIDRLTESRDTIRTKMVSMGLGASDDTLDELATAVNGIAVKTSSNMTTSGATVTAPAGYYKTAQSKSVSTATQATPSITVSSTGLITASATQSAGYVASGTKSGTKQLTTQAATTITPSTSSQTAVAKNVYTTGAITVAAMPTATQATPSISVSSSGLITASSTQSTGYVTGGTKSATKQLTTQASKTVTPGTSNQTAVSSGVYTTGAITVKGDANLKAENIKKGISIFGVSGAAEAASKSEEVTNSAGGKTVYINSEPEKLPDGYTRLKYIQSSGSQYVNTGFKPNQDTKVVMDVQSVGINTADTVQAFFGARSGSSYRFYAGWHRTSNMYYIFYNNTSATVDSPQLTDRMTVAMEKNHLDVGGKVSAQVTYANFACSNNMYLFAMNMDGAVDLFSVIRVFACQIYDNGTLVRDYVPCLNASGVAGLYDFVTRAFLGDAAGVGFIAGAVVLDYELPDGYEELNYIESTGSQYVNTGFVPNQDTRVYAECSLAIASSTQALFGVRVSSSSRQFQFVTQGGYYRTDYNTSPANFSTTDYGTNRFYVDKNKNITDLNGEHSYTHTYASFTCPGNMYIFATNNNGAVYAYASAKLYTMQIYDNGTIVRYYVPCRTNTGEVGLWDAVNSVFYGDAAGVGFIAGAKQSAGSLPDGSVELEYIDSNGTQCIDTGYVNTSDKLRIVLDFRYLASHDNATLFGSESATTNAKYSICPYGSAPQFFVGSSSSLSAGTTSINTDYVLDVTAQTGNLKASWNGTQYEVYYNGSLNRTQSIALFGNNINGTVQQLCSMRVRKFQIYDNDVLKRDMIPAKNTSGLIGMYDLVNDAFYPNAGTGTFEAGPELNVSQPGVSKVVLEDEVLIDLTGDTVTPESLLSGFTAHNAMGQLIRGAASAGRPFACGTVTMATSGTVRGNVSGLSFKPTIVFLTNDTASSTTYEIFRDTENSRYWYFMYDPTYGTSSKYNYSNLLTITTDGFQVPYVNGVSYASSYQWYAIGAGG